MYHGEKFSEGFFLISEIVSTCDRPRTLARVLDALQKQNDTCYEIIVADDSSDERTRAVIDAYRKRSALRIVHCRHERKGFHLTAVKQGGCSCGFRQIHHISRWGLCSSGTFCQGASPSPFAARALTYDTSRAMWNSDSSTKSAFPAKSRPMRPNSPSRSTTPPGSSPTQSRKLQPHVRRRARTSYGLPKLKNQVTSSIVVVTNQSGIGRGYYDKAAFERLTDWMTTRFAEAERAARRRLLLPAPAFEGKICTMSELQECARALPHPVVMTNGVFDILHRGHVTYLAQARSLWASLIVAINSDASVKMLGKGDDRPINTEADRAAGLASLESVSFVVIFEDKIPLKAVELGHLDIYVKGGDYRIEDLPETQLVSTWGARAVTVQFEHERSTTALLKKVRNSSSNHLEL